MNGNHQLETDSRHRERVYRIQIWAQFWSKVLQEKDFLFIPDYGVNVAKKLVRPLHVRTQQKPIPEPYNLKSTGDLNMDFLASRSLRNRFLLFLI